MTNKTVVLKDYFIIESEPGYYTIFETTPDTLRFVKSIRTPIEWDESEMERELRQTVIAEEGEEYVRSWIKCHLWNQWYIW